MQRTASERKRVNRRVNQRFLSALVEMGIPSDQAELALAETGNVGVEVAAEWLFRSVIFVVARDRAVWPLDAVLVMEQKGTFSKRVH